jgi:phosphatidylglycerophosphatase A
MEDIELARSLLEEDKLNLVIVKGGQVIFRSQERGVAPFFQAVQNMVSTLHNAAVADRIVGLAVAMLCLYARIGSVYGGIASSGALDILKEQGVAVISKKVVPHIFNYDGTDLCPFEKLARDTDEPSQLFAALQSLFAKGEE